MKAAPIYQRTSNFLNLRAVDEIEKLSATCPNVGSWVREHFGELKCNVDVVILEN